MLADEPALPERTRLGPPGRGRAHRSAPAAADLERLAARVGAAATRRPGAARPARPTRCARSTRARDRIVSYVGKLIVSKGVDLLLAAWPLVVARVPEARLVIVGFGTYREALGRFVDALRRRDLDDLLEIAGARPRARGRAARRAEATCARSSRAPATTGWPPRRRPRERVHFTGRLEHDDLPDLLPACEAQVMPSTFPEAFGMVAAEAAACGALPLSAGHSGMAEVTAMLAPALGAGAARRCSRSSVGPRAVEQIAAKLVALAHARPGRARARQRRAGGRGGAPLLVGERGRRGDRGRPGPPRRSTPSRSPSG